MTSLFCDNLPGLAQLNGKIALELVFAEPGKDTGLLPVNYLISQMEELCVAATPPSEVAGAMAMGRQAIDSVFAASGLWDAAAIERLSEWTHWMEYALGLLGQGQETPPLPANWTITPCNGVAAEASPIGLQSPIASRTPDAPLIVGLDDVEMLREFISESYEHLHNIELGVLILEEKADDSDTLNNIFRAFHTFKGGSGLLNLIPVNRLAHELESLLGLARQRKIEITSHVIDVILEGGDVLKQFTVEIDKQISGQHPPAPILIATGDLIDRVRAVVQKATMAGPDAHAPAAPVSKDTSSAPGVAPQKLAEPSNPSAATVSEPSLDALVPKPVESGLRSDKKDALTNGSALSTLKVATQKLDNLVDLTGEMVIAQSQVVHDPSLQNLADVRLSRNLTQLTRIANELQKIVLSLRMVPIRSAFQRMNRLVRDLSGRLGKTIELRLEGEDTELDRTLVEQLSDALVHMVRNAVDHGIESTEKRRAEGKPPAGLIELKAWHQGGNIIIEVRDDGGGLNSERILAKAIALGLVKPDDQLDESEIFNLILEPGFSLAEIVTDLSGRGVGMDVVRRNVEKLRGKIEIQSTLGKGSCFSIHLPLTLAIIDGMLVSVGEQRYILPALLVRESFRPTTSMVSTVQGKGEMVNVRGRLTPLLRLGSYFDVPAHTAEPTKGVVVVVGYERRQRCLLVDQLLGKQEVVIKGLGDAFKEHRAFSGAAILGDGKVGLILDVDCLLDLKK